MRGFRVSGGRYSRLLGTCAASALLGLAAFGATAAEEEFAPFLDCPLASAGLCTVAETMSGEFKIGNKAVPISQTITLQGGLKENSLSTQPLIPARDGNTLSKTVLKVPGGLTGIELLGGELTATAEIAGPATGILINQAFLLGGNHIAVVLPLKIKLGNPILGEECYIGSDADPIRLELTDGTTSPPSPAKPISGKVGTTSEIAKRKITLISGNTLVDNSYAVPAATGCGTGLLRGLITGLVNLDAGLPAAAGHNVAVMSGSFEQTPAEYARKYAKPPKEKKNK
jgi:hypothetical protein